MPGPNRHTEGLFDIADVTSSTLAPNGEIRFNIGNASTNGGIDRNVSFWGIEGFLSRPWGPSGGAAQCLYFCDGNQRYAIGSRDRRFYELLESIDEGDRMIHSPTGLRIRLDDSEQAIEMTTPAGNKQYFSSDLAFTKIANGTLLEIGETTIDATKLGTAENVALYAALKAYIDAQHAWIIAANAALVALLLPLEPGPVKPLTAALNLALAAEGLAYTNASNPLLASSSVLRASPT